jgi:hypothetical protein
MSIDGVASEARRNNSLLPSSQEVLAWVKHKLNALSPVLSSMAFYKIVACFQYEFSICSHDEGSIEQRYRILSPNMPCKPVRHVAASVELQSTGSAGLLVSSSQVFSQHCRPWSSGSGSCRAK